jgi:hypothetical protein
VPRATRTPRTFGICPSFKDHYLSPRAKALPLRFANFPSLYVAPYLGHAARLVLVQDGVQAAVAALRQRPRQRDVAQPHARRRRRVPRRGVRPLQNRPACVG